MKTRLSALIAVLVIAACAEPPPPPRPLPPPPTILSFEASAARVDPGEQVTLTFSTENATSAEITDGDGVVVPFTGDAASGTAALTPTKTNVYMLRVQGEGGRDSAFTRVAVNEDLSDIFLAAVPPEIESGGTSQLLWSAPKARAARIEVSGGEAIVLDPSTDSSGIVEVSPVRTTSYQLIATGVDETEPLTAEATVVTRAILEEFTLSRQAAHVGEEIVASWKTRGADEIVLAEQTFGELKRVSAPAEETEVNSGTFAWTIPAALPSGTAIVEGQPLRFTLTMKQTTPEIVHEQRIRAFVGDGARIDSFVAPAAVTADKPVPISWATTNAVRVEVQVNGLMVFETFPGDLVRAAQGTLQLAPIGEDLQVTLIATSHPGATSSETRQVQRVLPPSITSFTVPTEIATAGAPAEVAWTTENASYVALRPVDGAVVFSTSNPALLGNGNAQVYPGQTMTWVLEAWNPAGDHVAEEATIAVTTAGDVVVNPTPALPGTAVSIEWDLNPATTIEVVGAPSPTPTTDTAAEWNDLELNPFVEEIFFADTNDGVARLPFAIPFRFPFVSGTRDEIWVSTNGFVSFADLGPMLTNADLLDPASPEIIAPFWDNLDLGANGKVYYALEGNEFPRRLTIQWNKVTLVSNALAELTFQLQLDETGAFRFLYLTMTGTNAAGEEATIGVRAVDGIFRAQVGFNTAVLASDTGLFWFSGFGPVGAGQVTPDTTRTFGLFQQIQGGHYVAYKPVARVIAANTFRVTEAMPQPTSGNPEGQWVEIHNTQTVPMSLEGISLVASGASPFVLPHIEIPAQSYVVIGESTDTGLNGGAPVTHTWTGVSLPSVGSASLVLGTTAMSTLDWTQSTVGESVQKSEGAIDATGAPFGCFPGLRTVTFGDGDVGTPGAKNEPCFDYSLESIPGAYEDITVTGTQLHTGGSSAVKLTTLAVPFTYFGQPYTNVYVSTGGFITLGYVLTSTYGTNTQINQTVPGTPDPNGTIAPFWEEMLCTSADASRGYKTGAIRIKRQTDYTVIDWNNMRIWGETASHLFFQIKLFDSGVIEFHYGDMVPAAAAAKALWHTGETATTWIEKPDGSAALPVNINTVNGIQPQSGWRFTPKN